MGMKLNRSLAAVLALTLVASISAPVSADSRAAKLTDDEKTQVGLIGCETKEELDCVESFGFIDSKGNYTEAKLVRTNRGESFRDFNGNLVKPATTEWIAQVDGKEQRATLDVPLQSRSYVLWKDPEGKERMGSSLRPWVESSNLLEIKVRLVVRTSFLRPMNVQLVADSANFSQTKLPMGNSWMFEGAGTPVSNYTRNFDLEERRNFSAQADVDTSTLHFIIHHADADPTRGYWPPKCANIGYTVQAFNSNAAGDPYWDDSQQSLNFAIVSPHTKANGQQNIGFFKFWVSEAFLNCKFPTNRISSAPSLVVQIVNEDGTPQAASIEVLKKNGQIFINASGFHYSKPIIQIKPSKSSVVSSKRTLRCESQKKPVKVKMVSGTNPKCPKGYVPKK